jgi:hypothetical protein
MPLTLIAQLRLLALVLSLVIAAYLSYLLLGGLLVFGFGTPMDFALFFVPAMAFPAALLACWKPRVGAAAWAAIMVIFFGTLIGLNWPKILVIKNFGTPLRWFFVVAVLLGWTALTQGGQRPRSMPSAGVNSGQKGRFLLF